MPTTRMPTGQDSRMSETRNQKIPTPSITKILVTPLRVTSLRRSSNVVSAIRTSNQIMLYTDTFAGLHLKECLNEPAVPSMAVEAEFAAATSEATTSQVICSTSTDTPVEGYAFRGFHYVTAMVQLLFLGSLFCQSWVSIPSDDILQACHHSLVCYLIRYRES